MTTYIITNLHTHVPLLFKILNISQYGLVTCYNIAKPPKQGAAKMKI